MPSSLSESAAPEDGEPETLDEAAEAEESRPGQVALLLMQDEIERLDEFLALAREIGNETKVARLVDLIETRLPPAEPVLLFTEYKATQALVFSALEARFGAGCVGFINGDERLAIAGDAHHGRLLKCPATGPLPTSTLAAPGSSFPLKPAAKASTCRSAARRSCMSISRGTRCASTNAWGG